MYLFWYVLWFIVGNQDRNIYHYDKNNFPCRKNRSADYNDTNLFCSYLCSRFFRIGEYVPKLKFRSK